MVLAVSPRKKKKKKEEEGKILDFTIDRGGNVAFRGFNPFKFA
jgi:hypothetical protein